MKAYYVYILASKSRRIYIGITSDLVKRAYEHKEKFVESFTQKYKINRLVYYETTNDIEAAIAREKQIKKWRRSKKVELVSGFNPQWRDLYEDLIG